MRLLSMLVLLIGLLLQPLQARALTDEEHTAYIRDFQVYAQAEQRMNAAWKQLRALLSKDEFQVLLGEQRVWLSTIRDAEAKALAGPGPFADTRPLAEAYAKATVKRAEALEARSRTLARRRAETPAPAATADAAARKPSPENSATPGKDVSAPPAGKTGQEGQSAAKAPDAPRAGKAPGKRDPVAGSYGSGANLVEVLPTKEGYYVAVSTSAPDARWVCEMQGIGVLEGDILRINSVSSGTAVVIPIKVRRDALVIPPTPGAACGSGGSIEGVYKRK